MTDPQSTAQKQDKPRVQVPALSAEALSEQLRRVHEALDPASEAPLIEEWQRLSDRLSSERFSVVVAGEFSRGKSTLINKLLGRDLLPVGDLPTTAALTRITAAEEDRAVWAGEDGDVVLPLDDLERMMDQQAETERKGSLQVELKQTWLQEAAVELIDTPGVDDESAERVASVVKAIASADATLVAVSAVTPMSATERAFMETHVLPRDIPRLAIVVTRLDQVKEEERGKVLSYIRARRDEWVPEAKLWTAQGAEVTGPEPDADAVGVEAIQAELLAWAKSPEHAERQRQQASTQLYAICDELRAVLTEKKGILTLAKSDLTAARAAARHAVDDQRLIWDDLRLELDDREHSLSDALRDRLTSAEAALMSKFHDQLGAAESPAQWWNQDFPEALRRELASLSKHLEDKIQAQLSEDAAWLSAQVREQLDWQLTVEQQAAPTAELTAKVKEVELPAGPSAVFSKMGLTVAGLLAYQFLGPIGLAVPAGLYILNKKLSSQGKEFAQEELMAELQAAIRDALDKGGQELTQQLRDIYGQLLSDCQRQETLWNTARMQTAEAVGSDKDPSEALKAVNQRVAEATEILNNFGV